MGARIGTGLLRLAKASEEPPTRHVNVHRRWLWLAYYAVLSPIVVLVIAGIMVALR